VSFSHIVQRHRQTDRQTDKDSIMPIANPTVWQHDWIINWQIDVCECNCCYKCQL